MQSNKLILIELKLLLLRRQLEDIIKLMVELNDKLYVDELIALNNVFIRLENLRLYKQLKK